MDPRDDMERRKAWLLETQLRRLNTASFRAVAVDKPEPALDLISEKVTVPAPVGGRPTTSGPVYLDSGTPVWSADERARRDTFAHAFIGRIGNWLDFKNPARLAKALADLKADFESAEFASAMDLPPSIQRFERRQPGPDDGIGIALSRAVLAAAKPWLIPEIYNGKNKDVTLAVHWIENLEKFIADYETELQLVVGGTASSGLPFDLADTGGYRRFIEFGQSVESTSQPSDFVQVKLLDTFKQKPDDQQTTFRFRPMLGTNGAALVPVADFALSDRVKYWMTVFDGPVKEVVVLKPNSDMGLVYLVRMLYLFGRLPQSLGADADLTWRDRTLDPKFDRFFAKKAEDPTVAMDPDLLQRLRTVQAKLQIILESGKSHPRSTAPAFSPLAGAIVKQAVKSFKYWIDEQLRAKGNATLTKVKNDIGNDPAGKPEVEMEFWSENHYIMFGSSEYLLGQLWADEEFQPGKEFAAPTDKTGILTGTQRKERGRARVLKWLNNKLQFGWTEFNSSGYYREHLSALLNLVDFALDDEVRVKAHLAVDLLFFDVVRHGHAGSMGAAGGRSQFNSKNCGFDNALADVLEILTGRQGMFADTNSDIGAAFVSSSYQVPDVLLEMASSPPTTGFTDRSRVSITFDEAPKYGIDYSLKSDAKDSVLTGYAPKREKYYAFRDHVNAEIARTHRDYGATEDDTVFFWGMSAFFNKQNVRNSFTVVDKFDLDQAPVFKSFLRTLIETILPWIRRTEHGVIGAVVGGVIGAVAGVIIGELLAGDLESGAADDLSIFVEGSIRTRANIMSFRNPDAMLSSIQNFHAGQLNFQSQVNQVTLDTAVTVFNTAGFGDLFISDAVAAVGGFLVGTALGSPVLGVVAAAGAVIANEAAVMDTGGGFADDEDGVSWWTGCWALPMIVQHDSAAIIISDFHDAQSLLADAGSHVWFPKSGFDQVVERRTSAYDAADFPLLEIFDIGPKGFWLFGKIIHPAKEGTTDPPSEGYVGVFSNQRPEWLNQDFDLYHRRLDTSSTKAIKSKQDDIDAKLEDLEDDDTIGYTGRQVIEIVVKRAVDGAYQPNIDPTVWFNAAKDEVHRANSGMFVKHRDAIDALIQPYIDLSNLQRMWKKPFPDYFADHDWRVDGKNIWILQVGNKDEFGSFEQFMDRVSAARVHISDSGDMECSYDIPKPGGGSDRLTVDYGGGGQFQLNGAPFETDLYPRFENPFVRGGRVEWGQREYIIEWNGKSLLHDFHDFEHPVRQEAAMTSPEDADTVKALVIFLTTGDDDMDEFTVATATVEIGCTATTTNQVVAAGPIESKTKHDAEWIFFDQPARRSPDMTVVLTHTGTHDDTPEWSASFTIKALMGDRTLKDCTLSFISMHFEDSRRSVGPWPFVVPVDQWSPWEPLPDNKMSTWWTIATHPPYDRVWHGYHDEILRDTAGGLWHRRLRCGTGAWESVDNSGKAPDWTQSFSAAAVSAVEGWVSLFVVAGGTLVARTRFDGETWTRPWAQIDAYTATPVILGGGGDHVPVPLGSTSAIAATPSAGMFGSGADLYLTGADGNIYVRAGWQPGDTAPWQKFPVAGFTPAADTPVQVVGDNVLVLSTVGVLWAAKVDASTFSPVGPWRALPLPLPGQTVTGFAAGGDASALHVALRIRSGGVWISEVPPSGPAAWKQVGGPAAAADTDLRWATPMPGSRRLFGTGLDGLVRVVERSDGDQSAAAWTPIGPADGQLITNSPAGLAVACRAKGELEVFAATAEGVLSRTWWS